MSDAPFLRIDVMFLENIETEEGTKIRQVMKSVDPKVIFGEADVAQVDRFLIRFNWQPETPIEFTPRPYWMG